MKIPDKVYYNGEKLSFKFNPFYSCNIEYIHTDAFIEKACKWLEPVFKNYAGYYCGSDLLEDFKKAMML